MNARCLLTVLALLGCKAEDDQATRPLPAPEAPAAEGGAPLELAGPAPERPREKTVKENAEPGQVAARTAPTGEDTAAAPSAAAAPTGDANCQQACQASLQTCVSQQPPDDDGGTNIEGLSKCKKALEECKSRCSQ
jgi:hypothetical protein